MRNDHSDNTRRTDCQNDNSADRLPAGVGRHDLDLSLLSAWETLLPGQKVSIDDDFFELGGTKDMLPSLTSAMQKASGIDFSPKQVIEQPTIRELVDKRDRKAAKPASVLKLNRVEDGTPIFCLCGVLIYKAFAEYFDDHPVYGIYAEAEVKVIRQQSAETQNLSFDELTEAYVKAIKRHLPESSMILSGLSFGGLVALEVARKLRDAGYDIRDIILFDTFIATSAKRSLFKTAKDIVSYSRELGVRETLKQIIHRVDKKILRRDLIPKGLGGVNHLSRDTHYARVRRSYVSQDKQYEFDVLLVKADFVDMGFGLKPKHDYGLNKIISGRITTSSVSTGHTEMFRTPHAGEVYDIVNHYINRPRSP